MPMIYHIDRPRNLTLFRLEGDVSFDAFKDVIERYRDEGPTKNELYDFLNFSGDIFTLTQLNDLVQLTKHHAPPRPPGSKTALVVPGPMSFGASRQYQSLAAMNELPWHTEVFKTIEAARNWLGIEE